MIHTNAVASDPEIGTSWTDVCALDELSVGAGASVLVGNRQVAVFRIAPDEVRAVQNICPHKAAAVLHQGLVGDRAGVPVVLCPLHKKAYSLDDGGGYDEDGARLRTFACRIRSGRIEVAG